PDVHRRRGRSDAGFAWPGIGNRDSGFVRIAHSRIPNSKSRIPRKDRHHMKVAVFGLGYVGSVSAASFAADGHDVVGVDVNPDKVAAVTSGRSPIVEPGLDTLLERSVAAGRLRATTSTAEAVAESDLSLICVGTPSRKNGSLDLKYL